MPAISRAHFLRLAGWSAPAWLLSHVVAASRPAAERDSELHARIATLIEAYDSQGLHRTATPVDQASAEWLRGVATFAGADARSMPFAIDRVEVGPAYLDAGGRHIEGLPAFDGGVTSQTGVSGTLGPPGSEAEIVLVTLDAAGLAADGQSLLAMRRSRSHRAMVVITAGASPGLAPFNATSFTNPIGMPVLLVSSEHRIALDAMAAAHARVTLVAAASRISAQAINVVATVIGRQPNLAPMVVSTPRSAWWHSTSERGGGLACWVETLRRVRAASLARPAIFVASSGHELGDVGFEMFVRGRPELVKGAVAWIHLGAHIGAAGSQLRLQASDPVLEARSVSAIQHVGMPVPQRTPPNVAPAGEARAIHAGRGRYIALSGTSPLLHNPADRWPGAVDLEAVARYATAVGDLAVNL